MSENRDKRIFFALWPDEAVRARIGSNLNKLDLRQQDYRLVPRHNWHLTLHFIGTTNIENVACLHRFASKVKSPGFNLIINNGGYFKKPKVFWLGCEPAAPELFDLQLNLGRQLSQCDYIPETRPYSPHITVARKVINNPELCDIEPISWQVDRFVMVESIPVAQGVRYDVIESYPLDNGG